MRTYEQIFINVHLNNFILAHCSAVVQFDIFTFGYIYYLGVYILQF